MAAVRLSTEAAVIVIQPYPELTDPRVAKALAHPVRAQILRAMEGRVASPKDIADEFDISLGIVSYHVRRLHRLGLLRLVRRTPRRGAVAHYYTADSRPRVVSPAWTDASPTIKSATIAARLDHIGRHVSAAAAAGGFDDAEAQLSCDPIELDAAGWAAAARELSGLSERLHQIQRQSARRRERGDDGGEAPTTVVLMLFRSPPNGSVEAPAAATRVARQPRRRATAGAR